MTTILPISRIPTTPKPAAVPSLWNNIYDEIDDRLKKLNDGKQESGSGMDGFSLINSPAFTGNPTAPTPSTSDSGASVATTAFVQAAIASNVAAGSRPGHTYTANDWAWLDKPRGLMLQWGILTDLPNDTITSFSFPIAFPNAGLVILGSTVESQIAVAGFQQAAQSYPSLTASGASISNDNGPASNRWVALGY